MAQGTVLYRFRLNISDVDRSFYDKLDFRLALHPSESIPFLLTRMLAYVLSYKDGLAFSAEGLCDPDEPCISSDDSRGGKDLWIEVGNPSARRLHKAAKAANTVRVYTYKNVELLLKEIAEGDVYRGEKIEVFALDAGFLAELEENLGRDNEWEFFHDQGSLMITAKDVPIQGEVSGPFFAQQN